MIISAVTKHRKQICLHSLYIFIQVKTDFIHKNTNLFDIVRKFRYKTQPILLNFQVKSFRIVTEMKFVTILGP